MEVNFINSKRDNSQQRGVSFRAAGMWPRSPLNTAAGGRRRVSDEPERQTNAVHCLFFCSKGSLQSLDYVKNLQNVSGRRGLNGENVNPLFRYNNTITTLGIAMETREEEGFFSYKT